MKKTLMFACVAAAMLVSCGGNDGASNTTSEAGEEKVILADSTECAKSAEVAYVDLDAMFKSSKIFAKEGKPLEKRIEDFQKKMMSKQEDLAKREQGLAYEQNKIAQESAKLQSDYQKGLITTRDAQAKEAELKKRAENFQTSLQKDGKNLEEENIVFQNRVQDLLMRAVQEINAEKKYKMIVNSTALLDADPALDISDAVLAKVNEFYAAEKAEKK